MGPDTLLAYYWHPLPMGSWSLPGLAIGIPHGTASQPLRTKLGRLAQINHLIQLN